MFPKTQNIDPAAFGEAFARALAEAGGKFKFCRVMVYCFHIVFNLISR